MDASPITTSKLTKVAVGANVDPFLSFTTTMSSSHSKAKATSKVKTTKANKKAKDIMLTVTKVHDFLVVEEFVIAGTAGDPDYIFKEGD